MFLSLRVKDLSTVDKSSKVTWKGMEVTNKLVLLKKHIQGEPQESDFEFKTEALSMLVQPGSNDFIVKNLYVSIDPYQLNRMKIFNSSHSAISFSTAVIPGKVIDAYGIGKVVSSENPQFEKGDLVVGVISWAEYSVIKEGTIINKLDFNEEFPLSYHVGVLGLSGLTAYAGFFEVCKPQRGEKLFVSAASGSVGHLVGQYAKQFGCYVVGCAGSDTKVALLKDNLGFDDAFNYKNEINLNSTLKRYFPSGIDMYFDNVGSTLLEAAVANMNSFGRIAVCGVISEYTDKGNRASPDMLDVVYKRITMRGFLAADFYHVYADFLSLTTDHLRTGKLKTMEDISYGMESIPSAFVGLFKGDNIGKKMVKMV